jgi:hypothetical protein
VNNAVAFIPPWGIRIAHGLADAFVEQQRLDWPKEWEDQFKTHRENLTVWKPSDSPGFQE